jgi:phosphatidylglycerol:prolipoprotein diacylglycerol transferase
MSLSLTLAAIPFPMIDPVLVEFGPFVIRWYALAYVGGLLLGWYYLLRLSREPGAALTPREVDDMLVWVTFGVVLGGRLGYVLFYNPGHFLAHPGDIVAVWRGGMSYHGGMLGVVVAVLLFARKRGLAFLPAGDMVVRGVPIGLFLGRLANFINGELYGRPSDVPWAMAFPAGGPAPRHPSQLYEAGLEGPALFALVWLVARMPAYGQRPGLLTGVFCIGYAVARLFVELFREPDAHIGFLAAGATMGQVLSLPLLAIGLYLVLRPGRGGGAGGTAA